MPQVNVMIAGKAYRMACGEGEEARVVGLDFGEQVLGGHCALTSDQKGAQQVVSGRSRSLNPQIRQPGWRRHTLLKLWSFWSLLVREP